MTRSSAGVRTPSGFDATAIPSSSSSASSSLVNSLTRRLGFHAREKGDALRHSPLPGVWGGDGREPAPFVLEGEGALCEGARLVRRQIDPFASDHGSYLLQALFTHSLGENRVRLPKWIDAIDQIDVQIPDVHGEPPYALNECGV